MFAQHGNTLGRAIVAIPAHNEESQIATCLSALAVQRDIFGAPLKENCFEIILYANNCEDRTVAIAQSLMQSIPQRLTIVEDDLPASQRTAGWARRKVMDLAAARLRDGINPFGAVILTTDADTCVSSDWVCQNLRALADGVDCVAGYVDPNPHELVALGPTLLRRGRLEEEYGRLIAEIYSYCDPRAHDPWPNHRVSSGASLGVTLDAYDAIGGLPPVSVGEDAAFTHALERAGYLVRHSMDVRVTTSCRLDGRAKGGTADTISARCDHPDAPCDDDLEPALTMTRRATAKGMLRRAWSTGAVRDILQRLCVPAEFAADIQTGKQSFEEAWDVVSVKSGALPRGRKLVPNDLPQQINVANLILVNLRAMRERVVPTDKHHHAEFDDVAIYVAPLRRTSRWPQLL